MVSHWGTGGQRGNKETREAGAACSAKSYDSFVSVPGRASLVSSASIRERVVGKNIRPSTVISERHTPEVTQSRPAPQAALLRCCWRAVGAAAMKNSMEDPQQTKNAAAIGPSNPTPGNISGQNCNSKRYMHLYAHSSTIHNSQDKEAT